MLTGPTDEANGRGQGPAQQEVAISLHGNDRGDFTKFRQHGRYGDIARV